MTHSQAPRPICFIAMPFREKRIDSAREGAPSEVDFDALWDKAYFPAISEAGYIPVRADFDAGSIIVKDMVERLAFADLVLADVSLPNGNVYYELGLRHAARETGCIMFAADWSRQLFDIDQFRSVRYSLADGSVPDDQAEKIKRAVIRAIKDFKASPTPWYEFVHRPSESHWGSVGERSVFRKEAEKLATFQADLHAIRKEPDPDRRKALIRDQRDRLEGSPTLELTQVVVEMLIHIRDELDNGQAVLDFIEKLGDEVRMLPFIEEQRLLALAKSGEDVRAVAHLETLIERRGATPERLGLVGGRYKRLWRQARNARLEKEEHASSRLERQYLDAAISAYDKGMQMDLNAYYCACNLPPLLMERDKAGDLARAHMIDYLVVEACERAIARSEDDEWTRPTLLGAAFRAGNLDKAEALVSRIETEGTSGWKIDTTLEDLREIVGRMEPGSNQDGFTVMLTRMVQAP